MAKRKKTKSKKQVERKENDDKTVENRSNGSWGTALVIGLVILVVIISAILAFKYPLHGTNTKNNNKTIHTANKVNTANTENKANTGGSSGSTENTAANDKMKVLYNTDLFPALGPKNAKHTVIEFADFQCPYCALAAGLAKWTDQFKTDPRYEGFVGIATKLEKLGEEGKIRFIYVPMAFLGQESVNADEAAFCAKEQGLFWQMHDALFTANDGKEDDGTFTKVNLKQIAESIKGLNMQKFESCLDSNETIQKVQEATQTAFKFTTGTPTIFVDGKKVSPVWSQVSPLLQ